jgi:hypothetical protein
MLTNEKIGDLFGVTSSSISHSVRALNLKLQKNRQSRDKLNQIYSLFKIFQDLTPSRTASSGPFDAYGVL